MATVGDNIAGYDMTFEQRQRDLDAQEKAEQEKREREKRSPYKDFAQMNLEHSKDWRILSRQNHVAAEILWFLIEHADRCNALVCSSKVLEEALNYSRTTIFRAVNFLRDTGFIDIKKSGNTNVFLINKEITWKSWGTNYEYAEFEAKIIIAESEQKKPAKVKNARMNVVSVKDSQQTKKAWWEDDNEESGYYDESCLSSI